MITRCCLFNVHTSRMSDSHLSLRRYDLSLYHFANTLLCLWSLQQAIISSYLQFYTFNSVISHDDRVIIYPLSYLDMLRDCLLSYRKYQNSAIGASGARLKGGGARFFLVAIPSQPLFKVNLDACGFECLKFRQR